MKFIEVYLEDSFLNNETLIYRSGILNVEVGMRVEVPLRGRVSVAFVKSVYDPVELDYQVLPIHKVLDETPILNDECFALASYLSYQTVSPMISCLKTILPNPLKPSSSRKNIRQTRMVKLLEHDVKLTPRQKEFIEYFGDEQMISVARASKAFSGFRILIEKGVLELVDVEATTIENIKVENLEEPLKLTNAQQAVVDEIDMNSHQVSLLHGVTGSGKTEVYMHCAQKALDMGKSVLFVVPEIALTTHMIERISARFGGKVAVYHSGISSQKQYEYYMQVKKGEAMIALGTRSALFLPFENLGLIVMDEEHDSSYKQNSTPYYHARDVALWRSEYHGCPLILGSASPSLETYARAYKGVYQLFELPKRINDMKPQPLIVDTRKALYNQESAYLTQTLIEAIQLRLDKKEQVILLLNRRGYLPILKDRDTQEVLMCDACDVAMTYHKDAKSLRCHQCGLTKIITPQMRTQFVGYGVGTQRLVEALEKIFESASVSRLDRDSQKEFKSIMNQFENHEIDILVGTQMIAKGLDIVNVTLVGVVNADASLIHTDYTSVETTFSLILQACGRSGRGTKAGQALVQTSNPDHYAIQDAIHERYRSFFNKEMQYRHQAQYPPYTFLISIIFSDQDEGNSFGAAANFFKDMAPDHVLVLGPTQLRKLSHRYRTRVIIKGKNIDEMLKWVHRNMDDYRKTSRTGVVVDVNPINIE